MRVRRLAAGDRDAARALFALMAAVLEEESAAPSDAYLDELLGRAEFWAIAAFAGDELVGGITAHALPMTRAEGTELFVYDVAVRPDRQRTGVGRRMMAALRELAAAAGVGTLFVPADDEDVHALAFYRALGGTASRVTLFTFEDERG